METTNPKLYMSFSTQAPVCKESRDMWGSQKPGSRNAFEKDLGFGDV